MKINSKIISILRDNNINFDDGICYLISLYHGYEPTYIPADLKLKINVTKIVVPGPKNTGLVWNLPLYEGAETAFDWVKTEYCNLFKEKNPNKGGKVRESILRMKKFFADNPDIRKEEVIKATINYLSNTDPDYIRYPHYFIAKGRGVEYTSDLMDWVERQRIADQESQGRSSLSNIMQ